MTWLWLRWNYLLTLKSSWFSETWRLTTTNWWHPSRTIHQRSKTFNRTSSTSPAKSMKYKPSMRNSRRNSKTKRKSSKNLFIQRMTRWGKESSVTTRLENEKESKSSKSNRKWRRNKRSLMRMTRMKMTKKVKKNPMNKTNSMMKMKKNQILTSLKTTTRTLRESGRYVSMMKKYNKTKRENPI